MHQNAEGYRALTTEDNDTEREHTSRRTKTKETCQPTPMLKLINHVEEHPTLTHRIGSDCESFDLTAYFAQGSGSPLVM